MRRLIYETRPRTEARPYPNNLLQQPTLQYTLFEPLQVEVLRLKPVFNRGNLKAFADVRVRLAEGDWTIRDCRVIQQPEQRPYVSLPQREYHDRQGNLCYVTLVNPPDAIAEAIRRAVLTAWEAYDHGR